ncbi:tyrosine-type recombinase/integrase [Desulfosporosinus shakirovi]|uniref:tyrosine-type recombinase/integrase n=1 Tax=Desulfosporosinus shakirovi TaxID=2885154 RepID=UPI001E3E1DC4|nr:site-specific integrase [Desulfosporosinus sp. SRJS8]MCB8815727.1 site-specific integrase [Desulfosporosinus sp. SRJS8]
MSKNETLSHGNSNDNETRPKTSNGEGSVRFKTDNLVEGRAMFNGKNIYVYLKTKACNDEESRKKAMAKTRKKLKKAIFEAEQTGVVPSYIKLYDWVKKWVNDKNNKNKLKPKTYGDYISLIETHLKDSQVGKTEIQKLGVEDLEKFYVEKKKYGRIPKLQKQTEGIAKTLERTSLSIGTIRKMHSIIHSSLKDAVKKTKITRNVAQLVELPKEEEKKNAFGEVVDEDDYCAFSPDERVAFLDRARKSSSFLTLLVMLYTGMRVGEALALKWRNVDLERGEIRIRENFQRVKTPNGPKKTELVVGPPKTRAGRRVIPLPQFIVNELIKLKEKQEKAKEDWDDAYIDKDLVFCIENGNYREPRNFTRSFYNIRDKAGVSPINLHGLRHTYATMLFEKGVPAKTVSVLLGHTDVSVTLNIYSHVFPEIKASAIAELPDYASAKVKDAFAENNTVFGPNLVIE